MNSLLIQLIQNCKKAKIMTGQEITQGKKEEPKIISSSFMSFKPLYDNDGETKKMLIALKQLLSNKPAYLKICTGYFSPNVWKHIGEDIIQGLPEKSAQDNANSPVFELLIGEEVKGGVPKEVKIFIDKELNKSQESDSVEELLNLEKIRKELNELPLEIEIQHHIRSLIRFLERNDVQVALQTKPFVHGKLYLTPTMALVGSSNFTVNGLLNNMELNLTIHDKQQIKALHEWFDKHFSRATKSYKEALLQALRNCKLGTKQWSAYDVYMKFLFEKYKPRFLKTDSTSLIDLAIYQKEGVHQLIRILNDFGGAMLADSVGLGKSFQAIEVIIQLQAKGHRKAVIICPAQLRSNWEYLINEHGINAVTYSMEKLALKLPKFKHVDIIVIDESHNFRNKRTKRYKNLQRFIMRNKRAKVLLLTATPINTSIRDLIAQGLIMNKYQEETEALLDIGITNLSEYFKNVERKQETIMTFMENMVVARSRSDIRYRQELYNADLLLGGIPLRFPERHLQALNYTITTPSLSGMDSNEFYMEMTEIIEQLIMPYYHLEQYAISEELEETPFNHGITTIMGFIKVLLLKRLESSLISFKQSIDALMQLHNLFIGMIRDGFILPVKVIRELLSELYVETQDLDKDVIEELTSKIKERVEDSKLKLGSQYHLPQIKQDLDKDEKQLNKLNHLLSKVLKRQDQKFLKLLDVLEKRMKRGDKILVFSYFKDTANYLYRKLLEKKPEWRENTALITGNTSNNERARIVYQFAPESNPIEEEELEKIPLKEIKLLISTDVLSEGQNLQDANILINYDLHWNPVRIIQRIGRIDRLRSPHTDVWIYNFFPEDGLEIMLNLVERLVKRLEEINSVLELDGAVLTGEELQHKKEQLERLAINDLGVIEDLEAETELWKNEKEYQLLLREIKNKGQEYFLSIPDGVHIGALISRTEGTSGIMVGIRWHKKGSVKTLFAFHPDEHERGKYQKRLYNNILSAQSLVLSMINITNATPSKPIDNENKNGEVFKRVIGIGTILEQQLRSKKINYTQVEAVARGTKKYLKYLKFVMKQYKKYADISFPSHDSMNKILQFLSTININILEKETEVKNELQALKDAVKKFEKRKKLPFAEQRETEKELFVTAAQFYKAMNTFIQKNITIDHLERHGIHRKGGREKFELIGFIRIYKK